jgi:GTPase SAR1 family protein
MMATFFVKRALLYHCVRYAQKSITASFRRFSNDAPTPNNERQRERLMQIEKRAEEIYKKQLEKLDQSSLIPKERVSLPMVLLLGNHSSGKSTFINFLLNQKEQETGVAPTDDSFTVITRGDSHADQDGHSLMSDSRWAFGDLKQFGPTFLSHFRLKVRKLPQSALFPRDMMVVDTPGMIDTPIKQEAGNRGARGYEFLKVVRWFAERSDVILLLFDPNNPGTTGETLDVLTESLADLDYKFLLILNKVDQFTQVHDFARAYGSLCWNLAKVIKRKDIPRIYTMFTPTLFTSQGQTSPQLPNLNSTDRLLSAADVHMEELKKKESDVMVRGIPLMAFNRTRDEVISEIISAPQRRVDNIVTQLDESISKLQIAIAVSNDIRSGYRSKRMVHYGSLVLAFTVCPAAIGFPLYLGLPVSTTAGIMATALSICGGLVYLTLIELRGFKEIVIANMQKIFERIFHNQQDNYDLIMRWDQMKPKLVKGLTHMDLSQLQNVKASVIKSLDDVGRLDVRKMREQCRELRIVERAAQQQQQQSTNNR